MTRVPKNRAGGRWTESRYNSFITSQLRRGFSRWGPKHDVARASDIDRHHFRCAGYKRRSHKVKFKKNRAIDHIEPVVPLTGFTTWDDYIDRLFVEADKLQALCKDCHKKKTDEENEQRKLLRRK